MVNVIIPTYDAVTTLPRALDSLVSQTKKMFLVTVVQDYDNRDYSNIIYQYRRRGLNVSIIRTTENKGPGAARQLGIDNSKECDYVMFLDSDDMLMPNTIELLYREAKINNADFVSSEVVVEQKLAPPKIMKPDNVTWMHGKIYKKKYLEDNKIRFHDSIRLNEDSYFNLVAANSTNNKIMIPFPTYLWRYNENSLTRRMDEISFFKKGCVDYIIGQVQGLIDIYNIKKEIEPQLFGLTLINIYNTHMKVYYLNNYSLESSLIKEIKRLPSIPIFDKLILTKEFLDTIEDNLVGGLSFGEKVIFPSKNFSDWLQLHTGGEIS